MERILPRPICREQIKRTGERWKVNATAGGVVYELMDDTNESKLFAAYVDEDASLELVTPEHRGRRE